MKEGRLLFVDNLRILLIILVIIFHVAITYGAIGLWYYHEGPPDRFTFFLLSTFVVVIQSFFMGFYFLISGYFTLGSYNRKGSRVFLKERFIRLGIPLFIYAAIFDPAIVYLVTIYTSGLNMSFAEYYGSRISRLDVLDLGSSVGVGPLWFVEALLFFALIYTLYRIYNSSYKDADREERQVKNKRKFPDNRKIIFFILALSGITFLVRLVFPIGEDFLFLQLGFFPQYISLFVLGIMSYRHKWFQNISVSKGKLWLTISVIGVMLLPIILAFDGGEEFIFRALGGLNYESFVYAAWESFVGIGMTIGLLVLFRTRYNNQGRLTKAMSADAYTVYIIFAPVIVILSIAMAKISLHPLAKFVLVSTTAVPICFVIGHYIRKIPFAKNIL
jgi:glucan biosynthesis protein C